MGLFSTVSVPFGKMCAHELHCCSFRAAGGPSSGNCIAVSVEHVAGSAGSSLDLCSLDPVWLCLHVLVPALGTGK